ncbi:MAG: hypothetical protein J7M40_02320 [Planctomycetes bacterium]|nr:hypothetical protein [Planctomycetota bacterium]
MPVKIGCADGHVHILSHLCRDLPVAKVIEEVRKGTLEVDEEAIAIS